MASGRRYAVQAWVHTDAQRSEVRARAQEARPGPALLASDGGKRLAYGTAIDVSLGGENVEVQTPCKTVYWDGEIVCATFRVAVPDTAQGVVGLTLMFFCEGLELASVYLTVAISSATEPSELAPMRVRRVERAFASHASEDKREVLARIQGMRVVAPWMRIFYDTADLRQGEFYRERLAKEIDDADVLYLFWSRAAQASAWVDWEWRRAYAKLGTSGISPVPLESPKVVPPPDELSGDLNFNDWTLAYLAYEREIRRSLEDSASGSDREITE